MSITARNLDTGKSDNLNEIPATHEQHLEFMRAASEAGLALVHQAKNWLRPDPLSVLSEKYRNGPAAQKSAARAQMFLDTADLVNLDGALLSWLLKGKQKGFNGTSMTYPQIAECIQVCTGRKCSARSIQRHVGTLAKRKLISISWMATGGKILNKRNKWVAKRIRQIWVTSFSKLMIAFDPAYIDLPVPNRNPIQQKPRERGRRPHSLERPCNDNTITQTILVCPTCREGNEVCTTCLPAPGQALDSMELPGNEISSSQVPLEANCEHEQLTGQALPGKAAKKRGFRNRHARTWQALRFKFLSELERNLDGSCEAREVLRIAATQTDRHCPALVPSVLDWNQIIWTWADRSWHMRRKVLKKRIIPALTAAAVCLVPPDSGKIYDKTLSPHEREKAARHLQAYQTAAHYQKTISESVLAGNYPSAAKEWAQEHSYILDITSRLINAGHIEPGELDKDTREIFQNLADIIGVD